MNDPFPQDVITFCGSKFLRRWTTLGDSVRGGGGGETYSDVLWQTVTSIRTRPNLHYGPKSKGQRCPALRNDQIAPRGAI